MSAQHPPAASHPTGSPTMPPYGPGVQGQMPYGDAWAQHPAPPPARRMHVGAIIAIIVGGMLLLGMTFASGAAAGWWLGAHHGPMWSQNGPAYPGGPGAPNRDERHLPGEPGVQERPDS